MKSVESTLNKRYYELDSLRGLAALSVFFSHIIGMLPLNSSIFHKISNTPAHIFWDGSAAVILFFVLSGFVLALPYVGERAKPIDFMPFYIRRVLRIYPAYLAALAAAVALKLIIFEPGAMVGLSIWIREFWNWDASALTLPIILNHIMMVGPKFEMGMIDPIIWSLVVEMKISLIYPFIILVIRKISSFWEAAGLLAISMCIFEFTQIPLFSFIPLFILGGLLARFRTVLVDRTGKLSPIWCLILGAASVYLYTNRYTMNWLHISDAMINYIIASGVAVMIIMAVSKPKVSSVLTIPPIKFLGDVSYSFYLLHFPVMLACTSAVMLKFHSFKAAWLTSLVVSLILSYVSYKLIEKPFQKLGRFLAKYYKEKAGGLESAVMRTFSNKSKLPID